MGTWKQQAARTRPNGRAPELIRTPASLEVQFLSSPQFMNVRDDTTIRQRFFKWVCQRCKSPVKLLKQTSKQQGDCEKCIWCQTERAIYAQQWRKYPDSVDVFFGRI